MRPIIPLLAVLLLASAAPAEEPEKSEALASPAALTALEARFDLLQERLEHDLAERIERKMLKTFAKRVDRESVGLATAPVSPAPAAAPASRVRLAEAQLEPSQGSRMTCVFVKDDQLRCRSLASQAAR